MLARLFMLENVKNVKKTLIFGSWKSKIKLSKSTNTPSTYTIKYPKIRPLILRHVKDLALRAWPLCVEKSAMPNTSVFCLPKIELGTYNFTSLSHNPSFKRLFHGTSYRSHSRAIYLNA